MSHCLHLHNSLTEHGNKATTLLLLLLFEFPRHISGVIKQTGIVFIKSNWLSFCPRQQWNIFKQIPQGGELKNWNGPLKGDLVGGPRSTIRFHRREHILSPSYNPNQPFLTHRELSLIELSQNAVCLVYISSLFLAELAVYLSAKAFCFLDFLFSLLFDLRGGRTPMSPVC